MKTVIITRHAKSSWTNIGQTDFERPLNERGIHDAPMMGKRLNNRNLNIDSIISSTAIRAKETANCIAQEINFSPLLIQWVDKLYLAPPTIIDEVLLNVNDAINTLILVCHNPGITNWVNMQLGHTLDNMPTCAMMGINAHCNTWANFDQSKKEFLFLDFPKNNVF